MQPEIAIAYAAGAAGLAAAVAAWILRHTAIVRARAEAARAADAVAALEAQLAREKELAAANEAHARARLEDKDAACRRLIADKEASFRQLIAEKDAAAARLADARKRELDATVNTLREQFSVLAGEKLKASSEGLAEQSRARMDATLAPLREQLEKFRRAFEENRAQQVANKSSFEQAIKDLGAYALKIGADAENLAKALKSESKTQGNWGELVLANVLTAAGLVEGETFFPQAQETDASGKRLIPDVEIPLQDGEKLLIDSKTSLTAYLDYVAAQDDAAREQAARAHVESVRKHVNELADKNYIGKVRNAKGYILMFIPNEGSHLLALARDPRLATEAFRRRVIIVNPSTLLLCLMIVNLLRARAAQNANADRIARAAGKMYEKFAVFSETFADFGRRVDALAGAYAKAKGQLCEGPANVIRQLESLKEMGVMPTKTIAAKLVEAAGAETETPADADGEAPAE